MQEKLLELFAFWQTLNPEALIRTEERHKDSGSIRIFTIEENYKLSCDCRNFLLFLYQHKYLDIQLIEDIVEKAMQLDSQQVELGQLLGLFLSNLSEDTSAQEDNSWQNNVIEFSLTRH